LLALLGARHILQVSRIRVKLLAHYANIYVQLKKIFLLEKLNMQNKKKYHLVSLSIALNIPQVRNIIVVVVV
jgi:hypothetical protein